MTHDPGCPASRCRAGDDCWCRRECACPQSSEMKVTVSLEDVPETVWRLRLEFARLLRSEAEGEECQHTANRLREIASSFEVGVSG